MMRIIQSNRLISSITRSISSTAIPLNAAAKKIPAITSVAPAGTKLKGLNVFKNKEDLVALPEDEYPEWLWKVLDSKNENEQDAEAMAKAKRRQANRNTIKNDNFLRAMSK
jgi:large subunit ribosomal protein L54